MYKYFLFSYGYGILRNIYYIPKLQSVDTKYDIDTRNNISKLYEPLLGDKILMAGIGMFLMPVFLPIALYDDINRTQIYYNKEVRKQYQNYLIYNLFPYTTFSMDKRGCFDKNLE